MAKKLNARCTPNSGAGSIKGDIHDGDYLVEHKYTDKESYILKLDTLRKTEAEAFKSGKTPKWIFTICGKDYTLVRGIL